MGYKLTNQIAALFIWMAVLAGLAMAGGIIAIAIAVVNQCLT